MQQYKSTEYKCLKNNSLGDKVAYIYALCVMLERHFSLQRFNYRQLSP